ncbi:hypothetical protein FISHEDRAFT_35231 [Fistulina hepatica ATCC 64428]|uniref:Mismatched base pair and cruciform DNA recognition protein n=1 Tax=Fistulina hepatica ATCC 64428 TaxID=1128425 RepID=A0A0D7AKS9_9AGAR|nr:hypothetical protein FISHEDRAFT_35231 [Fistulina hepatica ATCC 64428]
MSQPTSNEPSKTSGQYHSMKGIFVEQIGGAVGSESWQKSGAEEHTKGETEYNAAQAKGYVEGLSDQVQGYVKYAKNVMGAVTGDRTQATEGDIQKKKGKAQTKVNEPSS